MWAGLSGLEHAYREICDSIQMVPNRDSETALELSACMHCTGSYLLVFLICLSTVALPTSGTVLRLAFMALVCFWRHAALSVPRDECFLAEDPVKF